MLNFSVNSSKKVKSVTKILRQKKNKHLKKLHFLALSVTSARFRSKARDGGGAWGAGWEGSVTAHNLLTSGSWRICLQCDCLAQDSIQRTHSEWTGGHFCLLQSHNLSRLQLCMSYMHSHYVVSAIIKVERVWFSHWNNPGGKNYTFFGGVWLSHNSHPGLYIFLRPKGQSGFIVHPQGIMYIKKSKRENIFLSLKKF